jgi:hypothetical protein
MSQSESDEAWAKRLGVSVPTVHRWRQAVRLHVRETIVRALHGDFDSPAS